MKISAVQNNDYTTNLNSNANNCQKSPNFGKFHATLKLAEELKQSGLPFVTFKDLPTINTKDLSQKFIERKIGLVKKYFSDFTQEQVQSAFAREGFSDEDKKAILASQKISTFVDDFCAQLGTTVNRIFTDNGSDLDIYVSCAEYGSKHEHNMLYANVPGLFTLEKAIPKKKKPTGKFMLIIPMLKKIAAKKYNITHDLNASNVRDNESAVVKEINDFIEQQKQIFRVRLDKIIAAEVDARKMLQAQELGEFQALL